MLAPQKTVPVIVMTGVAVVAGTVVAAAVVAAAVVEAAVEPELDVVELEVELAVDVGPAEVEVLEVDVGPADELVPVGEEDEVVVGPAVVGSGMSTQLEARKPRGRPPWTGKQVSHSKVNSKNGVPSAQSPVH